MSTDATAVAFRRYRTMSFVTGTTLLLLFAHLALKSIDATLWHQTKMFELIDGELHGLLLYPLYMIASFNMVLKFRLRFSLLILMLLAGFVPGLAFYMEHRMRRRLYPEGASGD
jgi:integral membrane protein